MAGILDSKTRFIDLIVTQEGKRQLASGKMRAEYASLSDSQAVYDKTQVEEINNKIYFEAMDSHNNVIVLEKDDSGKLIEFNFSPTGSISGDRIFDKDATATNTLKLSAVTGSAFSSTSQALMSSFTSHFKSHQVLGTFERRGNEFELNTETISFAISNSVPFPDGPHGEKINVNDAEPFFTDSKLSHVENFMYLPPVNMDNSPYGNYNDIVSRKKQNLESIKNELGRDGFQDFTSQDGLRRRRSKGGFRTDKIGDFDVINRRKLRSPTKNILKQFKTIYFDKTSEDNNLIIQIFEDGPDSKLIKLDLIDAGSFSDNTSTLFPERRIFFAGKVYFDDLNVPTFINIFTIILE
jgi:hypothetical protein